MYLSDWDLDEDLCDPMCGSGTIAIEAALILANCFPGLLRYGREDSLPPPVKWGDLEYADTFWSDIVTRAREGDARKDSSVGGEPRIHVNDIHPGAKCTVYNN